jgi:RNA-splicing ligase RtcB
MFHCGSRGFGHQVASDCLHAFLRAMPTEFGLPIIDRELACAPFASQAGRDYLAAMELRERMKARGILVRSASYRGLAEEAGFAYKSVDEVSEATELAGLSRRVAHLVPVANMKG